MAMHIAIAIAKSPEIGISTKRMATEIGISAVHVGITESIMSKRVSICAPIYPKMKARPKETFRLELERDLFSVEF